MRLAAPCARWVLGLAACLCSAAARPLEDAASLVQGGLHVLAGGHGDVGGGVRLSEATVNTPRGPMVWTKNGPVRGVHANGHDVFARIPYAEPPKRFERAQPKQPWAPKTLDATRYGPACIGSHSQVPEQEACLFLNIWIPTGGIRDMPVIVYFHGGMNQHGSGQESLRQGDMIVQSTTHPAIFINFDFRLGIFGWLAPPEGTDIPTNLGLSDQQMALRWVQDNIRNFGGDPNRVTLQGQSEGAGVILVHMVSPHSAGLFQQAAFHSPPADIWSPKANAERTKFILKRLGCNRKGRSVIQCLKAVPAQKLWSMDWVSEELSRNVGSPIWLSNLFGLMRFASDKNQSEIPTYLGWHPVIDGDLLPGEPRQLISEGRWNKVPVLITVSKNESLGIFPDGATDAVMMGLRTTLREGDIDRVKKEYRASLLATGIVEKDDIRLMHQMITDKMWTCDVRALARAITQGGGEARIGMFWHSPAYDPVGSSTNAACQRGATCHAAEMLYVLPQGRGQGVRGWGQAMRRELDFVRRYSEDFLAFVSNGAGPWVRFGADEAVTFYDSHGTRQEKRYRRQQCDVLDSSMGVAMKDWQPKVVPEDPPPALMLSSKRVRKAK